MNLTSFSQGGGGRGVALRKKLTEFFFGEKNMFNDDLPSCRIPSGTLLYSKNDVSWAGEGGEKGISCNTGSSFDRILKIWSNLFKNEYLTENILPNPGGKKSSIWSHLSSKPSQKRHLQIYIRYNEVTNTYHNSPPPPRKITCRITYHHDLIINWDLPNWPSIKHSQIVISITRLNLLIHSLQIRQIRRDLHWISYLAKFALPDIGMAT